MQVNSKALPKSQIELSITVTPDEYKKFFEKTARDMASQNKIKGFRPGKAPLDTIIKNFGEAEILEKALSEIVTHTFVDAVKKENIDSVGQPEVKIEKAEPNQDIIYTAIVDTLPEIKLADLSKIKVKKDDAKINDEDIKKTLDGLAKSRATEVLVDRPAKDKDMVKLDYNISIAGVPQDGGSQTDFEVHLGEKHMVPGFEENIIGTKAGDEKTFTVTFPKEYFQKNFAGKEAEFKVKIKGVYEINIPKITDEFATSLGPFKTAKELEEKIRENITLEKEQETSKKFERDLIEEIIKQSKFGEMSEKLIENEIEAIIHELSHDMSHRGLTIETWLTNMNKTMDELKKDLRPQAESRVKGAVIVREVAKKENIVVNKEEVKKEIDNGKELYKDQPEILSRLDDPGYQDHLRNVMQGEKVMNWIKDNIGKKEEKKEEKKSEEKK